MIICPLCGSTVEPCSYTSEIFYCPQCSMELNADDVRQGEIKLNEKVELPKQKKRITSNEARELWRQAVSRHLGVADWPNYTKEEMEEAQKDTLVSRYGWPEEPK